MMPQKNDFGRRTWDRDEYLDLKQSQNLPSSNNSKLQDLKETDQARYAKLYNLYANHNYDALMQSQLKDSNRLLLQKSTQNATGRKGKQFGFYCEICNVTFNNNMEFVEHLNDKLHFINFEKVFHQDVVLNKRDNDEIDAPEFKQLLQNLTKQYQNTKKQGNTGNISKSNMSRRKNKNKNKNKTKDNSSENTDMKKIMGFGSFK